MNIFSKFTLRTLQKNRTRTIVTIIGIMLSVTMITAITTTIVSLQQYVLNVTREQSGDWYGDFLGMSSKKIDDLKEDAKVDQVYKLQNIGYSLLDKCNSEYKPYLYIGGADEAFFENMPVMVTKGQLPKSKDEIILPKHLASVGGVVYHIGDTITVSLGSREFDGKMAWQHTSYQSAESLSYEEDGTSHTPETYQPGETRTYKVVGFYERGDFEEFSAPGYTALTVLDDSGYDSYESYFTLHDPSQIYDFMNDHKDYTGLTNGDLLRYLGVSNDNSFNKVLYGLAGVLILIIMIGSISLIYNAFSISVSERTKAFGLLSSIGATKKQMRKSVFFEAAYLCLFGIPLGILVGIGGIAVTLYWLQSYLIKFLNVPSHIELTTHVSLPSVLIACGIGFITVMISAWIPSRRALKINAIEAIRQSQDIKLNPKKLKASRIATKLFGFEGMLGDKNYKRNKKKYRATVASLFISVVLFISASSFQAYLKRSMETVLSTARYDLTYYCDSSECDTLDREALNNTFKNAKKVTKSSYYVLEQSQIHLNKDQVSKKLLEYNKKTGSAVVTQNKDSSYNVDTTFCFIDDANYKEYLKELNLDESEYMNPEHPKALVKDNITLYIFDNGSQYYSTKAFSSDINEVSTVAPKAMDGYTFDYYDPDSNQYLYVEDGTSAQVKFPAKDSEVENKISLGERITKNPFALDLSNDMSSTVACIYPMSAYDTICNGSVLFGYTKYAMASDDHGVSYDDTVNLLQNRQMSTAGLQDVAASAESSRALVLVLNVFSYGFVILISLIAIANVFNTISTNVGLRRREFAMLKSVGLTKHGFNKMMNFECLLYGVKGLIYGLPVSFGVTYLIYHYMDVGLKNTFFIPWGSVAIAVISVFLVVFSTMVYSMSKMKKENTIDALKNENL